MKRIRDARLAFWFLLGFVVVAYVGQAFADQVLQYQFVYKDTPPVSGMQVAVYQSFTFKNNVSMSY